MPVRRLCELHGVSRSWFYPQQGREEVDPAQALVGDIEAVVEEFVGDGIGASPASWPGQLTHRVLRGMRERRL